VDVNAPLRLLIVEDSEDDARLVVRELKRAGYEPIYERVDTAAAMRAALDGGSWDIVVSDFRMPQFTGTDALKLLRARDQETPFIFVSGTIGEDVAVEAMRAGAQDYVTKDNLRRLAPAIERELRDAAVRRERRAGETRFRRIVDSAMMGVLFWDAQGQITDANDHFLKIVGYTREDLRDGRIDWRAITPPEYEQADAKGLEALAATGTGTPVEREYIRKDGSRVPVLIGRALLDDPAHPGVAFVLDITERARAEQIRTAVYRIAEASQGAAGLESLLKSVHEIIGTLMPAKNFYIALYDEANDLITFPYFVDEVDPPPPPRRPTTGLTEHVLRSGKALLSRHELGPSASEAEHTWIGAASVDWLGVPLKQGDRTIGVIAVQTYTAGVRYEERDKDMLQYVSTQVAAAIERKRAEEALRDSEERFRALVEHSGDAIALLDREGRVTYASQSTAVVLGRDPQSIVGTNAFDFLHPDDVAQVQRTLATIGDAPGRAVGVRSRFRHADGTWRDGEGTVANRLDDPVVGAIVFNYRDVTDRHRLETQLRQAQKMEAVGRLAGGIAHDFNNVLTAVFGYVDLLQEELPQSSPAHGDLAEVRKAAERAAGLTRQLLAFSRQQVLEPVVLNLNERVEDFEKMLRRMIGEDVELRLTLRQDVGNVRADPGQLDQVLMNLVVNARDAMPQGGTLILETANADLTEPYAELHQPVVAGPYVMLAVSDTGMGMTPEVKARVFEPFFTTKERGKGTGLGLSTVYGIVKQSGGYIWAYSEPGRGTTFKIYLPRVDAPAEGVHPAREPGSVTGTETILLAEDDPTLRPLAKGVLARLGYRVLEAENAAVALAIAGEHDGAIHLLVADVVMPGASGRELARRLAESRPDTKVLYVSGYTDDAIVHHGILEPGLTFLQKPFTPAALAKKVREVLDAK
jgi:PAS domain S-box-containing protein